MYFDFIFFGVFAAAIAAVVHRLVPKVYFAGFLSGPLAVVIFALLFCNHSESGVWWRLVDDIYLPLAWMVAFIVAIPAALLRDPIRWIDRKPETEAHRESDTLGGGSFKLGAG